MKFASFCKASAAMAVLPIALWAQTTPTTPPPTNPAAFEAPANFEFTLGGSGATNTDFNSSAGGVDFSIGKYFNENLLGSIRQSVQYSNPHPGGTSWNGSTFLALDQHFGTSNFRPLIGLSLGRIYGDTVQDTWAAGLEAGMKYYVRSATFIYARARYAWLFDDGDDIEDTFSDGHIGWSVGIGFNF